MHPVANFVIAKALERAHAEHLSYALGELRDSFGKLRRMYFSHISRRGLIGPRNSDRRVTRFDRTCGYLERPRGRGLRGQPMPNIFDAIFDHTVLGNMFCV